MEIFLECNQIFLLATFSQSIYFSRSNIYISLKEIPINPGLQVIATVAPGAAFALNTDLHAK